MTAQVIAFKSIQRQIRIRMAYVKKQEERKQLIHLPNGMVKREAS